jgi:hypothetical protein
MSREFLQQLVGDDVQGETGSASIPHNLLECVAHGELPMPVAHVTGLMRGLLPVVREDQQFALLGRQHIQMVRCQNAV